MATWIFQGNPRYFDMDRYLRETRIITWTVNQSRNEISQGDEVWIWRADGGNPGSGGVVAHGTIQTDVTTMPGDIDLNAEERPRVRIQLDEVRLTPGDGMLRRIDLMDHPEVANMHILAFPNATNYKLSQEEADYLYYLWRENDL